MQKKKKKTFYLFKLYLMLATFCKTQVKNTVAVQRVMHESMSTIEIFILSKTMISKTILNNI